MERIHSIYKNIVFCALNKVEIIILFPEVTKKKSFIQMHTDYI